MNKNMIFLNKIIYDTLTSELCSLEPIEFLQTQTILYSEYNVWVVI